MIMNRTPRHVHVLAGVAQASYPRVSFLASVAASNVNRQLEAIQADMRSNLTAHFAPVLVAVTFSVLPNNGRRRLLDGERSNSLTYSLESGKLVKDLHGALSGGVQRVKDVCQDEAKQPTQNLRDSSEKPTKKRRPRLETHAKQAGCCGGEKCDKSSNFPAQSCELSRERWPATEAVLHARQLLQSGTVNLQVNVTFPSTSQNSGSQGVATAFDQALQTNPSSVLGGFEQGYGAVGVTSVALSYVTASDSGLGSPPAISPPSSGDGSVGTFIGIAVAAVLGLTALAGKHLILVSSESTKPIWHALRIFLQ